MRCQVFGGFGSGRSPRSGAEKSAVRAAATQAVEVHARSAGAGDFARGATAGGLANRAYSLAGLRVDADAPQQAQRLWFKKSPPRLDACSGPPARRYPGNEPGPHRPAQAGDIATPLSARRRVGDLHRLFHRRRAKVHPQTEWRHQTTSIRGVPPEVHARGPSPKCNRSAPRKLMFKQGQHVWLSTRGLSFGNFCVNWACSVR